MDAVLRRKLERLREEALYLENSKKHFLEEVHESLDTKKIVERSVYLCAEIALDIADTVIALKGLPKPSTYGESIRKRGEYKIIPKDFAKRFFYVAGLRNFLAHDYQIDTTQELGQFLKSGIGDIKKFIRFLEKL